MKPPERELTKLVARWVAKAEMDLEACQVLSQQPSVLGGIIAFHAQQATEKYLKAALTQRQLDFARTHDLGILINLLAGDDVSLSAQLKPIVVLTDYGVEVRYPGELPEVSPEEAAEAVQLARLARDVIRPLLPAAVLD